MKTRIALLRHGHTAWNRAGRIQGRVDEPLDAEARAHLAGLALPEPFVDAALVSSPLRRAFETAAIIGRRAPTIAPELIEMDWGGWEGKRGVDLIADPSSGYRHIEEWGWDFCAPGGESPRAVLARLEPWLERVSGPTIVVTHIGVMRVLLARALAWNFSGEPPFQVKRDRLYVIDVQDDGSMIAQQKPVRLIPVQAGGSPA